MSTGVDIKSTGVNIKSTWVNIATSCHIYIFTFAICSFLTGGTLTTALLNKPHLQQNITLLLLTNKAADEDNNRRVGSHKAEKGDREDEDRGGGSASRKSRWENFLPGF